jgi:UDP-N-acetylmuramyl pentapeptide synthase
MAVVKLLGAKGSFTSVHTDSREVQPGGLFFALKGAEKDGHGFVADALARGAAGIVVERPPEGAVAAEVVVVPDTWAALYRLARTRLEEAAPIVVGITGSNGKTSTKEMLAAILATRFKVLKTEGNLNTETGVPLTILRLEPGVHEVLVLEMGMQAPGEIARLAELASPEIGIVTGVGTVHIEFFDSVEGIARAKAELVGALPADGLAILNHDDPTTPLIRGWSRAPIATIRVRTRPLHVRRRVPSVAGWTRARTDRRITRSYRLGSGWCVASSVPQRCRNGISAVLDSACARRARGRPALRRRECWASARSSETNAWRTS